MAKKKGYTILRWNGEYSDKAVFIVMNNQSGKRTLFTPDKLKDIMWTKDKIEEADEYKDWQEFGNEQIEDLADVVF